MKRCMPWNIGNRSAIARGKIRTEQPVSRIDWPRTHVADLVRPATDDTLGDDVLASSSAIQALHHSQAVLSRAGRDQPGHFAGRHPAWRSISLVQRECLRPSRKTAQPSGLVLTTSARDRRRSVLSALVASHRLTRHQRPRFQTMPAQASVEMACSATQARGTISSTSSLGRSGGFVLCWYDDQTRPCHTPGGHRASWLRPSRSVLKTT